MNVCQFQVLLYNLLYVLLFKGRMRMYRNDQGNLLDLYKRYHCGIRFVD